VKISNSPSGWLAGGAAGELGFSPALGTLCATDRSQLAVKVPIFRPCASNRYNCIPRSRTASSRTRLPCRAECDQADEITARQLHALKQHYTGKLRLPEIKEMFEQMKDRAQVRQAAPTH
jgi:hypothetical protein